MDSEILTWRCRGCGLTISETDSGCSHCGSQRPEIAPAIASLISSNGCSAVQNNVLQLNVGVWSGVSDSGECPCPPPAPAESLARRAMYASMSVFGIAGAVVFLCFAAFMVAVLARALYG